MPRKDYQRLDFFFRELFFFREWAYTLIGSKPVSTYGYTKPWPAFKDFIRNGFRENMWHMLWYPSWQRLYCILTPHELKIKQGWETLNKYVDFSPYSRFALYDKEYDESVPICLVDKCNLIKVIKEYREDFGSILSIDPDEPMDPAILRSFLQQIEPTRLWGIIYGYGRDNGCLFEKYEDIDDLQKRPMSHLWEDEIEQYLERINQKIWISPWELSDLFYPTCTCDPNSEETRILRETYRKERQTITNYYEGKDLVSATLSLLLSDANVALLKDHAE